MGFEPDNDGSTFFETEQVAASQFKLSLLKIKKNSFRVFIHISTAGGINISSVIGNLNVNSFYLDDTGSDARVDADCCRSTVVVIVETSSFWLTAFLPPLILLPLTKSGLPLEAVRDI